MSGAKQTLGTWPGRAGDSALFATDAIDAADEWRKLPSQLGRVLVVEDDDSLRRALCRLLRRVDAEVWEADCVARAVQQLALAPELVITDVRLPDGSGRRVVELASRQRPAPLIVAMSGSASAREAFALAQGGARAYLTKPFAERDLLGSIADACREDGSNLLSSVATPDVFGSLRAFSDYYGVPEREMALVRLAMAGVPRARCPDELGISENTCKTLTRRLLQRCGARSLAQIPRLVLMRETPSNDA